jgi:SnoaL-like domain
VAHDRAPVQVVLDFFAAVRDQRIKDVLALVDPEIVCMPLVRPGRTLYEGHDGMVRFVNDMHAAFGSYQFEMHKITEQEGPQVTAQARMLPESGRRPLPPLSVVVVFTLRDGLITLAEGNEDKPDTNMP